MTDHLTRRTFGELVALSGAALAFSSPLPGEDGSPGNSTFSIQNELLRLDFSTEKGTFDVLRQDGRPLVSSASVRLNLSAGKLSIATPTFEHRVECRNIRDVLGAGQQLAVWSRDAATGLAVETRFSLYEQKNNALIEVTCRNESKQDIGVKSIEPVCALGETGGALTWPRTTKVLTNGPMYYDAGMVHHFAQPYQEPAPYGPTKGGVLSPDFPFPAKQRVRSWWNVGFFCGYEAEGLVCGFVDNKSGLGQVVVSQTTADQLSLYTESVFAPATVLRPGGELRSNRFLITIASDPYSALEDYANVMGILNQARCRSIINGWCDWFFNYGLVTEDEVLRNAEFAARYLKPYGFEYIQIDEGYQRFHGDWEGNERFPHGMKWLAERIKSVGLKPGLWLAPYVVSEPTEVVQQHPEWLLQQPDGRPLRVGPWPSEETDWARNENPKRYGLDITHPAAADWLFQLFDTAANQWGYEMFKIDFVAWSLLSAQRYYDPTVTPAQAYRRGMEIIRRAIGPERHLNDCGPGPVSVGLIDSMRIEYDQYYGYGDVAWQQYFLGSSSSAPAAAKRYYFHQRTWINDADHVCINHLSVPRAQAAASLIALSGGNLISGDRLPDLDPTRLEILKKVFPAFGQAARPVDLFDTDRHQVFALSIERPFGRWTIVGFFNPSEQDTANLSFPLNRLWLNPDLTYLAYDFWGECLWGEVTAKLEVTVLPAQVTLLALREKTGTPQVIGTDRHVLQGAIELEEVGWDAPTETLAGVSTGPRGSSHNVAVYLPEEYVWVHGKRSLHHDFGNYTLKLMDNHLLRVHLRFTDSEQVRWEFKPTALG